VTAQLENQQTWFQSQDDIETRLQTSLERLDPKKTYNDTQLIGKIDTIARGPKLNFDTASAITQEGDIFNIHSVRIVIKKAGLNELIEFDRKIKMESPYLGLERVQIVANKADPRLLDAQFVISSFELKTSTL